MKPETKRVAGRLRLPHDETDESKRYTMPDPDALCHLLASARDKTYPYNFGQFDPSVITREEMVALTSLAEGYLTLTTYELGQEHCVEKLRDIWRARRADAQA